MKQKKNLNDPWLLAILAGAGLLILFTVGVMAWIGPAIGNVFSSMCCSDCPSSFRVIAWLDQNGDGKMDPGEPPFPGVTISLRYRLSAEMSIVSDASGKGYLDANPLCFFWQPYCLTFRAPKLTYTRQGCILEFLANLPSRRGNPADRNRHVLSRGAAGSTASLDGTLRGVGRNHAGVCRLMC